MERSGHMGDAFSALKEIAGNAEVREWASAVAEHLGVTENLDAVWPEYKPYYTVDTRRTVYVREPELPGHPFVSETGERFDAFMVRPVYPESR